MLNNLYDITHRFTCSQGSSVYVYDSVRFLSNYATGMGVGRYALVFGGGAISMYDTSVLFVTSGVTLRMNRSLSPHYRADRSRLARSLVFPPSH
jgi:hypothetical protein